MILNTITLHNFMSYADATLDFSAISVACLCGPNGAGKSALLDAITWSLWECARSSSDELIKLGEKEMWVDLTFSHEGQMYRVRRARQKAASKSGLKSTTKGSLEFQVWNSRESVDTSYISGSVATAELPDVSANLQLANVDDEPSRPSRRSRTLTKVRDEDDNGLWRTLTGASMRDTQKAITDLLRMDFDTFVNSAYLRQGRADEFTMRAPTDRKQVLSDILGLSFFDTLQERSKDKARGLKARQEVVESTIKSLSDAECEISSVELALRTTSEQFSAICLELDAAEQKREHLQHKLLTMNMLEQRVCSGEKQLEALDRDIQDLRGRERELLQRKTELTHLMERSPEISEAARLFESLKSQIEELDRKSLLAQELSTTRLEHQTDLARQRSRLELDVEHSNSILLENEEKLRKLNKEVSDAPRILEAYERFVQLAKQEAEMAKRQESFVRLSQRANELHNQIGEYKIHLEADLMQKELSLTEFQSVLGSKTVLESQRTGLHAQLEALERLESEFELVEQRGLAAKSDLETTHIKVEELKRRQQENIDKIAELSCHTDSSICPLCSSQIVDRAAVIQKYRDDNLSIDREISMLKHQLAALENDRALLRKEYVVLKQKLETRKQLDTEIGQFNERLNAVARAEDNLSRLQAEQELLRRRLEQQDFAQIERESLVGIKAEIIKLEFDPIQFASIQSQIRVDRHIEIKHQQLEKDLSEVQKIELKLPESRNKCAILREQLETESYGVEARAELLRLQNEIVELSYDKVLHSDLKVRLSSLIPKTEEFRDLQRANADLPVVDEALNSCRNALVAKLEESPRLAEEIKTWQTDMHNVASWEGEHALLQRRTFDLRVQREDLAKSIAVTETQLDRLNVRLAELAEKKTELELLRSEIEDYTFLAEAFGKKGIQAVIIENAIPEIEAEANRILSRLSDNKMHVALVTQQRTKSGGVMETLDLLIGDEVGTRNYECFSGGEAFKVNFAIRVALSRLLARRSGAKLETLIIDEGFGSQDDASRDRLVKAIRSIQTEFARILVITHMPDVREMFPMQIQVSKVHGASAFQLIS